MTRRDFSSLSVCIPASLDLPAAVLSENVDCDVLWIDAVPANLDRLEEALIGELSKVARTGVYMNLGEIEMAALENAVLSVDSNREYPLQALF